MVECGGAEDVKQGHPVHVLPRAPAPPEGPTRPPAAHMPYSTRKGAVEHDLRMSPFSEMLPRCGGQWVVRPPASVSGFTQRRLVAWDLPLRVGPTTPRRAKERGL